jgi:hypothetical protein
MARTTTTNRSGQVSDPVDDAFRDLRDATQDLIDGDTRFVLVCGPVAIGKSDTAIRLIRSYSDRLESEWQAKSDQEKDEDKRRTIHTGDGRVFMPPFVNVSQRYYADLYCAFYWFSFPGEIGVIDDVRAIRFSQSQDLLNDAADVTRGGKVVFQGKNVPGALVPREYNHQGGFLVIGNWTQEQVESFTIFSEPVLSRGAKIFFPREAEVLFSHVYRRAFVEKSLMGYLTRLDSYALGADRGLGLSSSEAEQVLAELASWYSTNDLRVKEHSFRMLRRVALQRRKYPNEWRRRAGGELYPNPRTK